MPGTWYDYEYGYHGTFVITFMPVRLYTNNKQGHTSRQSAIVVRGDCCSVSPRASIGAPSEGSEHLSYLRPAEVGLHLRRSGVR